MEKMSRRLFYLDCPDEIGSSAILCELSVAVNPAVCPAFSGEQHILSRSHFLCKERKSNISVAYKVASDHVYAGYMLFDDSIIYT